MSLRLSILGLAVIAATPVGAQTTPPTTAGTPHGSTTTTQTGPYTYKLPDGAQIAGFSSTFFRDRLYTVEGHRFISWNGDLHGFKYLAVVFASPSDKQTDLIPKLVRFYQAEKPDHPEFEVVMIESGQGDARLTYLMNNDVPWPVAGYDAAIYDLYYNNQWWQYLNDNQGLMFMDAAGKVIASTRFNQQDVPVDTVLQEMKKTLAAAPEDDSDGN